MPFGAWFSKGQKNPESDAVQRAAQGRLGVLPFPVTKQDTRHTVGVMSQVATHSLTRGEPNMAMTDWDDLDQFLGEVPDEDFERPDALDPDKANRMLRKLRRLQRWAQNTEATANAEIQRIAEWRDGRTQMIGAEIRQLEGALEGYMRALNSVDGKVKTQNLPNGTLRLRAPRTRVVVDEPAVTINWILHRIANRAGDDSDLDFAHIDAVLDALNAEPLLRVKVDVAGNEIARATDKGPSRGQIYAGGISTDPPSNVYEAVTAEGEAIPGVALHAFAQDTFGYTLSDDTPEEHTEGATEDEL